jgi:hypothetical protein
MTAAAKRGFYDSAWIVVTVLTATLNPRIGRPDGVPAGEVASAGAEARASRPWAAAAKSCRRGTVEIARVPVGQAPPDRFVGAERGAFLASYRHRLHKLLPRSIGPASRISLRGSTSLADVETTARPPATFWGRAPPA